MKLRIVSMGLVTALLATTAIASYWLSLKVVGAGMVDYANGATGQIEVDLKAIEDAPMSGFVNITINEPKAGSSFLFRSLTCEHYDYGFGEAYVDGIGLFTSKAGRFKVRYRIEIYDNSANPKLGSDRFFLHVGDGSKDERMYEGAVVKGDIQILFSK